MLIRNAQIVDGTGSSTRKGSVRIQNGRIADIGMLKPVSDERVLDAEGLTLAPGFIDTHSHADFEFFDQPDALAAVSQGVTTVIIGQDGFSQYPLTDLFSRLAANPIAVNVASHAGHNTIRERVMGDDSPREANAAEVQDMCRLLVPEMEAGALGLSTGLEYKPGKYSNTEEVLKLGHVAAGFGGRYISHMRSEDRFLEEAIEEIIWIGTQTGMPVHISHFKLAIRSLWGQADRFLRRLDEARAEGVQLTADVYPYESWQSLLSILLPDDSSKDREAASFALRELAPPERLLISRFDPEPEYEGRTVSEIAEIRGTDPVTTYLDLVSESENLPAKMGEAAAIVIGSSMDPEDVARIIAWPHTNICTDGSLQDRHPRGMGSFSRILGSYVREGKELTLEAAIRKMTGLAAEHMGMRNRGVLRTGTVADLVLFDPQRVADRATLSEPHLTSVGIERVWVNGVEVYVDGSCTGEHPGVIIRRDTS